MGNMYRKIDKTTTTTAINSFKNALLDKYGADNVTIHHSDTTLLLFSCPQISDKTFRIQIAYTDEGGFNYGSGYSSGTNVADASIFAWSDGGDTHMHLVLGDSFLFISIEGKYPRVIIIGKTTGGISICYGAVRSSDNLYNKYNYVKDVTNNRSVRFLTYSHNLYASVNVPYISPLVIIYDDTNLPLKKEDGTFDTIDGLYMSYYRDGFVLRENAMFSFTSLYSASTVAHTFSSIMAEIDPTL